MRILLTSDERPLNAAGIAEEAAFAKRNINDALLALADARVVKVRWAGNERLFTTYRDKWAQLLEVGPRGEALPTSRPWTRLLRALTAIHIWTEHADPEWSDYLVASEGRQLLESLAPELSVSGVDVSDLGRTLPHSGPEAIAAVIKRLLEHPRPGRAPRRRISSVDSSRVV